MQYDSGTHFAPFKPLFKRTNTINHLWFPNHVDKLRRIDPDRKRTDLGISTFKFNPIRKRLEAEDTGTGGEKVSGIVVRVEPAVSAGDSLPIGHMDLITYPMRSHCKTPSKISRRTGRIL